MSPTATPVVTSSALPASAMLKFCVFGLSVVAFSESRDDWFEFDEFREPCDELFEWYEVLFDDAELLRLLPVLWPLLFELLLELLFEFALELFEPLLEFALELPEFALEFPEPLLELPELFADIETPIARGPAHACSRSSTASR